VVPAPGAEDPFARRPCGGSEKIAKSTTMLRAPLRRPGLIMAPGLYDVMRRVREEGVSDVRLEGFGRMEDDCLPSEVLEERYKRHRTVV
jgi:hypothetical protein